MTIGQAVLYGIIQGVTEWLPISSTAHLRVVPGLLHWSDPGAAFTAISQWGTLLAAILYFRKDIVNILMKPRDDQECPPTGMDRRLLVPVAVGTLPVVVSALLLKKHIEGDFRSLYVIAASLIVFAALLALAEWRKKHTRGLADVTWVDGLVIGLGQACSIVPGASRSGTTITAALFCGLERSAAARLSFILSLPAVFLAGAYELVSKRHEIAAHSQMGPTIIATVVAFVVGYASIDWLIRFLRKHPTTSFIVYRVALGCLLFALLAGGRITP